MRLYHQKWHNTQPIYYLRELILTEKRKKKASRFIRWYCVSTYPTVVHVHVQFANSFISANVIQVESSIHRAIACHSIIISITNYHRCKFRQFQKKNRVVCNLIIIGNFSWPEKWIHDIRFHSVNALQFFFLLPFLGSFLARNPLNLAKNKKKNCEDW